MDLYRRLSHRRGMMKEEVLNGTRKFGTVDPTEVRL